MEICFIFLIFFNLSVQISKLFKTFIFINQSKDTHMEKRTAIKHIIVTSLLSLVLFVTYSCPNNSDKQNSKINPANALKAKIVYFSIPGWPYCKKVTTIVNGLEKEYNGAVKVKELSATTPESRKMIASYGLTTHGMLIFNEKDELVKKLDGHFLDEPEIRSAIEEVIKK